MELNDFFKALDKKFINELNPVILFLLENNFITEEEFNDLQSEKSLRYIANLGVKHYTSINGRFIYFQKIIGDINNIKFIVCDNDDKFKKQFIIIINKNSKEFIIKDL